MTEEKYFCPLIKSECREDCIFHKFEENAGRTCWLFMVVMDLWYEWINKLKEKMPRNLVEKLVKEFGEFKKVCSAVTGKCYRVPTRHIIEHGLTHDQLINFPKWDE